MMVAFTEMKDLKLKGKSIKLIEENLEDYLG